MQLSVIIVNYNVRHFLEQCLHAVQQAASGLMAEIIVVDNHSQDGSVPYLQQKFSSVKFIANKENLGFAKACNQGFCASSGKYLLFLNPDTIVPEDSFQKCITFLETHPKAGALGVKMLDGSGHFLRESKRAFPSPSTSLYKLTGLAALFPKSRVFAKYHLGHLDENSISEVDVLAGAFMMVKRSVFEEAGGFDETFFMYGEDVDLSYRIQKTGYSNFYFPDTPILHFKGESTRKGSLNYVRMFYNAMSIFVRKHYGGSRAGFFNFLIHLAIWARAFLSATGSFIRRIGLPLIDAGLILLSFWLVKNIWSSQIRPDIQYESRLLWIAFPAYTVFFLIASYYAGLYDRWYKWTELLRAMLIATVFLLAGYSLLPEQYRFSRGIILFGALVSFLVISIQRWMLMQTGVLLNRRDKKTSGTSVVVGSLEEYGEVMKLLAEAGLQSQVIGRVSPATTEEGTLGNVKEIDSLSGRIPFRNVIFCQGKLSFRDIIDHIQTLPAALTAKVHARGSDGIVTSKSKDSAGETVSAETALKLAHPYTRRIKRLIDVTSSILFLVSFPIHLLFIKKPFSFIANCFLVLFDQKTWIGYAAREKNLPSLNPGVIGCNGLPVSANETLPNESLHMIDYWYARDYEPVQDIKMIMRSYRKLGNS